MDPGKDHVVLYHKERERQGHEIPPNGRSQRPQKVVFAKHLKLKQTKPLTIGVLELEGTEGSIKY